MPNPTQSASKPRWIASSSLFVLFVAMQPGCEETPVCRPGSLGPYDNTEGQIDPNIPHTMICFKPAPPAPPPPPPPPPPDLGGFRAPDPPGPKDVEAVMKAAIFVQSCIPYVIFSDLNINGRIDATYSAIMASPIERAIAERVNCFKDKTNGCEAVRECLGIAVTPDENNWERGCANGIGVRYLYDGSSEVVWMNCASLGLECYEKPWPRCDLPRVECDPEKEVPTCTNDNAPRKCEYVPYDLYATYQTSSCNDFGLACAVNADSATCVGTGQTCTQTFSATGSFLADYRAAIACENDTTLRACVNGQEQMVDCTSLGEGFSCIGGLRHRCAFDFQCGTESYYLQPTCDGTSLRICNSGIRELVDCTSLGFSGCDSKKGVCTP